MTLRQLGGGLNVVGGLLWIARWLADLSGTVSDVLLYVGMAFMLIGLMCIGLTLVKGSARWLDFVVGFAMPALIWSVYATMRQNFDDTVMFDGVIGVIAVVVGLALALRSKPRVDDGSAVHA